jgi:hypothetical protein
MEALAPSPACPGAYNVGVKRKLLTSILSIPMAKSGTCEISGQNRSTEQEFPLQWVHPAANTEDPPDSPRSL